MRRRTRLVLLAAAAGLVVPTAVTSSAASAVDQDLTLTATSGAAGTEVTASSASCDVTDSEDGLGYLSVRLVSGTGPDAVLAGVAVGIEDQAATFVVPDWVDPTDDAVVEASCFSIDASSEEPTFDEFTYDPIAFDVEGSGGSPVQNRVYSRTSLLAGQAFQVDASGCFIDDPAASFADVIEGTDLTFPTGSNFVAAGQGDVDGESFSTPVALSNGGLNISVGQVNDDPPTVEGIDEFPTDIPAGTYSTISYCSNEEGVNLLFEPQLIEVTGNAPFDDVDLTVPAESRTATLAGGSCTSSEVNYELAATDIEEEFGEPIPVEPDADAIRASTPAAVPAVRGRAGNGSAASPNDAWARTRSGGSTRTLVDGEFTDGVAVPGPDGAWSVSDETDFDRGVIEGYAWCGDPLAEGFIYDPQGASVAITPVTTTVPTTTPVAPVPANAVSGTPTYAG